MAGQNTLNCYYLDRPDEPVSAARFHDLGIAYWKLEDPKDNLAKISQERGYTNSEQLDSASLSNDKFNSFKDEHLHEEDEVKFFENGSAYLDVRDAFNRDRWIRIEATKGDLIILPAGVYHRFLPDSNGFFQIKRLFSGNSNWTPFYRSDAATDSKQIRSRYISHFLAKPNVTAYLINNPTEPVSLSTLADLGVLYWKLDASLGPDDPTLKKIRNNRGYNFIDYVESTKIPNLKEKLAIFNEEHLHEDEEIRFFINGSGYFDVRDKQDRWIRIEMKKGDMIILPAGIWHRFVPDSNMFFHVMRLFCGDPVWTPFNRIDPVSHQKPARLKYETTFLATGKRKE